MPREQLASRAMALMVAPAMPSRAITRQVADRISSRRASQSTIFGMGPPGPGFLSDVRLTSQIVYRNDSEELQAARGRLVSYSARLLDDGLAVGSAGNMSVRCGDVIAIPPSGISYSDLRPADICLVTPDGSQLSDGDDTAETPSSETP